MSDELGPCPTCGLICHKVDGNDIVRCRRCVYQNTVEGHRNVCEKLEIAERAEAFIEEVEEYENRYKGEFWCGESILKAMKGENNE